MAPEWVKEPVLQRIRRQGLRQFLLIKETPPAGDWRCWAWRPWTQIRPVRRLLNLMARWRLLRGV